MPVLFLEPSAGLSAATLPDGPDLTRYFLACGGLLVLVLALAFGFRRVFAKALAARAARRSLRIVDALPLGRGKRLLVVNCYDRVFLVGEGDKELNAIAELDEQSIQPTRNAGRDDETGHGQGDGRDIRVDPLGERVDFPSALVDAGGPAVRPAPRRPVLEGGKGILG